MVRENNRIGRERQEGVLQHWDKDGYFAARKYGTFEMVKSKQKCVKFRIRWKGGYEVIRCFSDINYLVKLARTEEIVVNLNKMKGFR